LFYDKKNIQKITNNTRPLQLFCFHYAGGNSSIYFSWKNKIHKDVELLAIQLPGRANLLQEELLTDLDLLVRLLYKEIEPYLNRPFAFFGHSMGGFIAYALIAYIEKVSQKKASFIIISATPPPNFYYGVEDYLLPNEELKKKLKNNNATPNEILNSKELMDIILPIYRADCKLLATHKIIEQQIKTKAFLFNSEEDIKKKIIMQWQKYFLYKVEYIKFEGGHFFIHKKEEDVIKKINYIGNSKI